MWSCALALGVAYLLIQGNGGPSAEAAGTSLPAVGATPASTTGMSGQTVPSPDTADTAATSAASTSTTRPRGPLTLAAGGDVIGDRQVGVYIDERGGDAPLSGVAPLLQAAHVAFVNLESPLSDKGERNAAKDVTFRGRPSLVGGLASAGVDVVSLANNHALDWGEAALLDTIRRLEAAGVAQAGAGPDLATARQAAILETPAGTVAVLAYSNVLPEGFPAGSDHPGINPMRPDRERVLADVAAAADRNDWVAVSLHWGIEYQGRPEREQRAMAHDAVDAGADIVLGHHPHVLQGLELYRNKIIAYSLGDFVFDHYSRETGEAFVLEATLHPAGPPAFTVTPVYLSDAHGIPRVVTGAEADAILDRLERYSDELGVRLAREGDRSVFVLR